MAFASWSAHVDPLTPNCGVSVWVLVLRRVGTTVVHAAEGLPVPLPALA